MLADCVAYASERESLIAEIGESGEIVDCGELLRRCLFGDCKDKMIGFLAVVMRKRSDILQLRD